MTLLEFPDRPAWLSLAATTISYGLVLAVLFLALFVIPYLLLTT